MIILNTIIFSITLEKKLRSTSASSGEGQFKFDQFDFGQFDFRPLAEVGMAEVECPRFELVTDVANEEDVGPDSLWSVCLIKRVENPAVLS